MPGAQGEPWLFGAASESGGQGRSHIRRPVGQRNRAATNVGFRPIADISASGRIRLVAPRGGKFHDQTTMKLTALLVTVAAAGALIAGCDDRDFFRFTPMEELASFEVEAGFADADATLERLARRRGAKVHRDPNPREQAIPSDYLATVYTTDCLLMVEGRRSASGAKVKVTLDSTEGGQCNHKM